jgi:radical SAM protein with 4Fe4S-binding SPASM domain
MTSTRPPLQALIFEVTQRCNHACRHCYNVWQDPRQSTPYPDGQLDPARTLELLARVIEETGCRHITLTGGEPLLRPDLLQIVEFLHQRHVQVTVISNGRLLDEQAAAALIQAGVGLFELPLLSHLGEVHDELSGAPGAWQAVLTAMTNIRRQHGQVVTAFVATRRNIEHLQETIRLAFAFGARGVMFNRFNPGGRGRERLEEILPSLGQVQTALSAAEFATQEYGIPVSCSIPIQPCLIDHSPYPHVSFGFCSAGTDRAYYAIDPQGNLRPCNHSDTILGNLLVEPFAALTAPERISTFASAIPAFCSDCNHRLECHGGCKASAQVCYGSLTAEEPFLHYNHAAAIKTNPTTTTPIPTNFG